MSYDLIVNGMNGDIKVENTNFKYQDNIYNGSCFTITLPAS